MLDFEHLVADSSGLNQIVTTYTESTAMNLPEISDIGLLDAPRHIEVFRREMAHCKTMSVDVALAATHQMLSRMANRQNGKLSMADVGAVLDAIQRAR